MIGSPHERSNMREIRDEITRISLRSSGLRSLGRAMFSSAYGKLTSTRPAAPGPRPTGNSPRDFRGLQSSPSDKNILIFRNGKSGYKRTRPAPPEGRSRSSRTWERDAVDADAPLTNGVFRGRQKRVVLTPHGWRQVGGGAQGPTGRRAPYSPATVTNKS